MQFKIKHNYYILFHCSRAVHIASVFGLYTVAYSILQKSVAENYHVSCRNAILHFHIIK